jgi:serine/threonine protein kinase
MTHRDLKPENSLIVGGGYVVLSDLNLSARTNAEYQKQEFLKPAGTPGFMHLRSSV